MYIDTRFEVGRTGKLKQHFTLYQYSKVASDHFRNETRIYFHNLGFDLKQAMIKAKKIAGSLPIDVYNSDREIINKFEAFGLHWNNGKNCYYADPNQEFWEAWKQYKSELKEEDFYVTKHPKYGFTVFFKRK